MKIDENFLHFREWIEKNLIKLLSPYRSTGNSDFVSSPKPLPQESTAIAWMKSGEHLEKGFYDNQPDPQTAATLATEWNRREALHGDMEVPPPIPVRSQASYQSLHRPPGMAQEYRSQQTISHQKVLSPKTRTSQKNYSEVSGISGGGPQPHTSQGRQSAISSNR